MLHLSKKTKNRVLLPLVFLFFLLINLTANGGHTDISDGFRAFLNTENLALNGKLGYSVDLPSQDLNVWFITSNNDLERILNVKAELEFTQKLSQLEKTQNQEVIQEFKNNKESWIEMHDRGAQCGPHRAGSGPGGGVFLHRHQRPHPVHPGGRPRQRAGRQPLHGDPPGRPAVDQDGGPGRSPRQH